MKNFFEKNKNYLVFYFVVLLSAILFVELSFFIQNTIFDVKSNMNTVISSTTILLMDIVIFSLFDMYFIKKVRNMNESVSLNEIVTKYPQVLLVNAALAFISYELGYAIVLSANSYCAHVSLASGTMFTAITALFLYTVKMFFGFSIQEIMLNDEKMHVSLITSFKMVCNNIKKVVLYNLLYLIIKLIVLSWGASYVERCGTSFLYNVVVQLVDILILVINTKLYINLILKKEKTRKFTIKKKDSKTNKEKVKLDKK